ncbi:hypothetical protein J120_02415 [candidate division TM6 bacterium JCVI TM6SC1]|uniref:Uncharacterized protein n=1 Tax=candidate division TM6 bacterium JCVI TM6SC1 TaxID=1306947 RepID=A0A0D2K4M8_9BACT|nr:hypothetical protein J120_02415 [candidate division TM6 bacterium JCVI TM6SC1]
MYYSQQITDYIKQNRAKLQQELPSILLLSIFQIILSYYFPPYMIWGNSFRILICTFVNIISMYVYVTTFSSAHKYKYYINFDSYDYFIHANILKKITKVSLLLVAIGTLYFYWRIDLYSVSNMYYILLYSYYGIGSFLLYRSVYRAPIKI